MEALNSIVNSAVLGECIISAGIIRKADRVYGHIDIVADIREAVYIIENFRRTRDLIRSKNIVSYPAVAVCVRSIVVIEINNIRRLNDAERRSDHRPQLRPVAGELRVEQRELPVVAYRARHRPLNGEFGDLRVACIRSGAGIVAALVEMDTRIDKNIVEHLNISAAAIYAVAVYVDEDIRVDIAHSAARIRIDSVRVHVYRVVADDILEHVIAVHRAVSDPAADIYRACVARFVAHVVNIVVLIDIAARVLGEGGMRCMIKLVVCDIESIAVDLQSAVIYSSDIAEIVEAIVRHRRV